VEAKAREIRIVETKIRREKRGREEIRRVEVEEGRKKKKKKKPKKERMMEVKKVVEEWKI